MRMCIQSLASLSGFRIRRCFLWCRSQIPSCSGCSLGLSSSSDSAPGLGTSLWLRYSCLKKKKTKKPKVPQIHHLTVLEVRSQSRLRLHSSRGSGGGRSLCLFWLPGASLLPWLSALRHSALCVCRHIFSDSDPPAPQQCGHVGSSVVGMRTWPSGGSRVRCIVASSLDPDRRHHCHLPASLQPDVVPLGTSQPG